jgi:hypothetical protein
MKNQLINRFVCHVFPFGDCVCVFEMESGELSRYSDGLQAGRQRFDSRQEQGFCLLSVQTGSWAHPTSYLMGNGGDFPGGKAAGAWIWPLTSIKCRGKEWWGYTSNPPHVFMALCLISRRENYPELFTFEMFSHSKIWWLVSECYYCAGRRF